MKTCKYKPFDQTRAPVQQPNQQRRVEYEHEIDYDAALGDNDSDNDFNMDDADGEGDRELEKLLDHTVEAPKNIPETDWSLLRLQRDFHLSNPETSAISK